MAQPNGRDPSRPFVALVAPRRIESRLQRLAVSTWQSRFGSLDLAVSTKRRYALFASRKAELSAPRKEEQEFNSLDNQREEPDG